MSLKDTQTEQNLKDAFAGESQANRRYLYFAAKADVEGYNDVATVFRSTAEGETGLKLLVKKVLMKLPIGLRRWVKQSVVTLTVSRKLSITLTTKL